MANQIEGYLPVVQSDGLNSAQAVNFTGTTTLSGTISVSAGFFTSGPARLFAPSGTVVVVGDYGSGNVSLLSGGTVTINAQRGQITTLNLTASYGSTSVFTLSNNKITAGGIVLASVSNGSNTGGVPVISTINQSLGIATITIVNTGTISAFNGSVVVNFYVVN